MQRGRLNNIAFTANCDTVSLILKTVIVDKNTDEHK